jgi:hypothetical protein
MAKRKQTPAVPARDLSHMVEDAARAGEHVGIRGERGAFRILREVLNVNTGAEWIELRDKEGAFRAVRPNRIVKRRQPKC